MSKRDLNLRAVYRAALASTGPNIEVGESSMTSEAVWSSYRTNLALLEGWLSNDVAESSASSEPVSSYWSEFIQREKPESGLAEPFTWLVGSTSPGGHKRVVVETPPTTVRQALSAKSSPFAAAAVGAAMILAGWRRVGSESRPSWSGVSFYQQLSERRISIAEARQRARLVQVNADRCRLEFLAREADRDLALAGTYDL